MKGIFMKGDTEKYAWQMRLFYGSSSAAAQALGRSKQAFSTWLNGVHETRYENILAMKEQMEAQPLSLRYERILENLHLEKGRQGQRSDLKKTLQPLSALGAEEGRSMHKLFLQLRPALDEVVHFVGRTDELVAKLLNLKSKHDVHFLKKVLENRNAALTAKMDSGELTPYQAADFVGLPMDVQNGLLQKSRAEQIAGMKAWKLKQQQGGENMKD